MVAQSQGNYSDIVLVRGKQDLNLINILLGDFSKRLHKDIISMFNTESCRTLHYFSSAKILLHLYKRLAFFFLVSLNFSVALDPVGHLTVMNWM